MGDGLASTMVYGSGEGQNTKHYYAGTVKSTNKKSKKCKKGKQKG